MRDKLLNFATVVMTICAIAVTALLVRREVRSDDRQGLPDLKPRVQSDWERYAESGHSIGPDTARITIVEFADYECPSCRRFAKTIELIRSDYKGGVRLIYRHFPLPNHRFAIPAVRASECAASQGRFEQMHDALFAHADSFGLVPWTWFASRAGLRDTLRFSACMRNPSPMDALSRDTAAARQLGVRGTPTLLIGPLRVEGAPPIDSLRALIARTWRPN